MPEVNEVRLMADLIRKKIKGSIIRKLLIHAGRYKTKNHLEGKSEFMKLLPLKVLDVKTKGKLIYIIFEKNVYLISKLGLMGSWIYNKRGTDKYAFSDTMKEYSKYGDKEQVDSYIKNALNHLNIEFVTDSGSMYYSDVLSYGTLKFVFDDVELHKYLAELGPDIMEETTTFEVFEERILLKKNLDKPIGNVLVNQKVISGIGNYLRADILYISKVNPFRKVKTLDSKELKTIYESSKILTLGVYDEKKAKKLKILNKNSMIPSKYKRLFFIYMQDTDIYGNKVLKKELFDGSQKRFVYYVKEIQK